MHYAVEDKRRVIALKQSQHRRLDGSSNRIKEAYYTPKAFRRMDSGQGYISPPSRTGRWAAGAFIVIASFGAGYYFATRPEPISHIAGFSDVGSKRPFNMPSTGVISMLQIPAGAVVAPLKLNGSTDTDCLFELRLWKGSDASLLRAFVRSRETLETRIPLGRYAGTITCGSSWYGPAEFGPNSSTDQITAPLEFVRANTGQLQGMVIDLTRRAGGNLPAFRF